MKFTVLYRHGDSTKDYFERVKGKAYGDGVNLVRLDEVSIMNKKTREITNKAYAFRCEASLFDYLRHKKWYGMHVPHFIGWKHKG